MHIGIFLDDKGGLLIAQVELMLDDQAADHDPGIYCGPTGAGELSGEDLHTTVPWEMMGQFHPSVGRVQFHLVKIAKFLKFKLVLGDMIYHIQIYYINLRNSLHNYRLDFNLFY